MTTSQTEIESQVIELATEAFNAFCDDIAGMFGVGMQCEQLEVRAETVAGLLKGKYAYMSPEQCRGQKIDARTDVWAIGVVLFRALAGKWPHDASDLTQPLTQLSLLQFGDAEGLMGREPGLLQRMGEGIVADVVQQGRHADRQPVPLGNPLQLPPFVKAGQGAPGEMVSPEGVLKPAVGGAGIDQEGVTDLAHVAQSLHRGRIQRQHRPPVQSDVVPERIPDDFQLSAVRHGGIGGAIRETAG